MHLLPSFDCILACLEQLLHQEDNVLENWTEKKKKLEQCHQYVLFEQSARQVSLRDNSGLGDNTNL